MHRHALASWRSLSLTQQFLLAGGVVALFGTVIVGWLVTTIITINVTRNAAATTALYVDSTIAPLLPDMQQGTALTDGVARALDEVLANGALGKRLQSFKLWDQNGVILYSKNHAEIGREVAVSEELASALSGQIVAQFNDFDEYEKRQEGATGLPLLEIYNPVFQPWSGKVVAVSEFYEVAEGLRNDLRNARVAAVASVAVIALSFFVALFAIVRKGSATINMQRSKLRERVDELTVLLSANEALRVRVQTAAQRTTALNEFNLRRIGADLHDGPAQLIALAALRLDTDDLVGASNPAKRLAATAGVRAALSDALAEIRTISGGLILPNVENAPVDEVVHLAVRAHEQRNHCRVKFDRPHRCSGELSSAAKICVYRFVQEGLNNAQRHAGGEMHIVRLRCHGSRVLVEVVDFGRGFDVSQKSSRLGLAGMRDRIESIGGNFKIASSASGTRLSMILRSERIAK